MLFVLTKGAVKLFLLVCKRIKWWDDEKFQNIVSLIFLIFFLLFLIYDWWIFFNKIYMLLSGEFGG